MIAAFQSIEGEWIHIQGNNSVSVVLSPYFWEPGSKCFPLIVDSISGGLSIQKSKLEVEKFVFLVKTPGKILQMYTFLLRGITIACVSNIMTICNSSCYGR